MSRPPASLLLDRLPARPVLIAAAAVQAVTALVLTQVSGIGPVLALATGFGVGAAVLQPGLGAIVPRLAGPAGQASQVDQVSRVGLTRANSYLQAATWGGFTAGPLLAGVLTAAGSTGLALAGVAVIYALGAAGLWALPLAPQAATAHAFGGLANGMEVVATRSFLNHRAPEQVAGRVFAVYSGVLFGAASAGMAAAGGLLSSFNPRAVLFLAGGGGLAAGAVGWLMYARRHGRGRPSGARPASPLPPPER